MSDGGLPDQNLSVVPEQVRDVGKYVYELAEALRSALDSAARDVDSLTNGTWSGQAATTFSEGWTDVHDGGGQIIAALAGMAEKLGVTAESYAAQDDSNAAALNITSSLDLP